MFRNVIDTDDYAASGIEVLRFAGGEWHAKVPVWPVTRVHVHAKLRTPDEVMCLLGVLSALETQGVEVHLFAPYFPGLRQDRNPNGTTPLTSAVYGRLLAPYCATITTVDAHSEAGLREAGRFMRGGSQNLIEIKPNVFLADLFRSEPSIVVAPDKGATERATEAAAVLNARLATAEKVRDFDTGKLTDFRVTQHPYTNGRLLIVDDICDGGGTFLGLLTKLREFYPENPVDLYVTHGIFSKGYQPLMGFDAIYTTDSFFIRGSEGTNCNRTVRSINLLPYYLGGLRP